MLTFPRIMCVFVGFSVLAGPAKADERSVPGTSWTGCFIGATIGKTWGTSKQRYGGERAGVPDAFLPVGFDVTGDYDVEGRVAGGEIGCNYQFNGIVAGFVLDGADMEAHGLAGPTPGAIGAGANPLRRFHTDQQWLATARARLGIVRDRSLWYVTAGAAWSGFEVNNEAVLVSPTANRAPTSVDRIGWIVGVGAEYALDNRWRLKSELLYADFGTFHYSDSPAANGCVQCYSMNVEMSEWTLRVGLSYQFLGP